MQISLESINEVEDPYQAFVDSIKSPDTFRKYRNHLHRFLKLIPSQIYLDMNGVPFTWKRINSTFPELNNDNDTRAYDREEIQRILEFAGPLEKAII